VSSATTTPPVATPEDIVDSSTAVDLFHVVDGDEARVTVIICHHGLSLMAAGDLAVFGFSFNR
jgi:hypothetical protein